MISHCLQHSHWKCSWRS